MCEQNEAQEVQKIKNTRVKISILSQAQAAIVVPVLIIAAALRKYMSITYPNKVN